MFQQLPPWLIQSPAPQARGSGGAYSTSWLLHLISVALFVFVLFFTVRGSHATLAAPSALPKSAGDLGEMVPKGTPAPVSAATILTRLFPPFLLALSNGGGGGGGVEAGHSMGSNSQQLFWVQTEKTLLC